MLPADNYNNINLLKVAIFNGNTLCVIAAVYRWMCICGHTALTWSTENVDMYYSNRYMDIATFLNLQLHLVKSGSLSVCQTLFILVCAVNNEKTHFILALHCSYVLYIFIYNRLVRSHLPFSPLIGLVGECHVTPRVVANYCTRLAM